ncbi:MAG TPA: DUF3800 domain-containing protein [Verrucomicrobia subdivision 3 bacterium]|nr:DUF3800 domain-containing protein [Limisphaerales bacterium]
MEYIVYCDESRHDGAAHNRFMSIGSLWLPRSRKTELTQQFRALRESIGLKGEIKWSKVSTKKLEAYQKLVGFFFDQPDLRFRAILVDQSKLDLNRFHGGDRELGFYKFYFEMLEKWIVAENRYLVLLDFKKNKGADRYTTLRRALENKTKGRAWIDDLTVIDSSESPLAQLSDLLAGAVAATWCGFPTDTAKSRLAGYIGQRRGASLLAVNSSAEIIKFNLFKIQLEIV